MAGGYGKPPGIDWGSIGSGAAAGTAIAPGIGTVIGAGVAAIPSIFSAISGAGQRRQAKRLRASLVDPGYSQNQGILQNKQTLQNRYGNYKMPGFTDAMNRLGTNAASAFTQGIRGATSSNDVLDLATKIAYGTGLQENQLAVQNATGKEGALKDYLGANELAGQEQQNVNKYAQDKYQRQLQEAAALYGAGSQNINSGLQDVSSVGTSLLLNPKRTPPKLY